MAREPLIEIDGVVKRFGKDDKPALAGVTANVMPGMVTGLVGPDGAGKTTLIRMMTALLEPTEGDIRVFGAPAMASQANVHAGIGYMPQKFGLYEDLTVQENINLYADLRGLPESEREEVFGSLLNFTALAEFTARPAGKLSGGMKQKLGLACAMITRPKLLILDEPGVGVDPISRRELWAMVQDLTKDGTGIVWSTAYLDEAERCQEVIVLNQGELIFEGEPQGLTNRVAARVRRIAGVVDNRRAFLRDALETDGVIDGVIQGAAIRLVLGEDDVEKTDQRLEALCAERGGGGALEKTEPRFEDAFMDALGGGPGGRSRLAERAPKIEDDTGEPVVVADGLTKQFGDFVASHDITFKIPRGRIFGLLGPNGAGKSTSFKMLCGLLKPIKGAGSVAGLSLLETAAEARSRLGYMAQKFSLYGDLSVKQNLEFFAGVYGLKGERRREAIASMIDIFDLKGRLNTSAKDLPLGFKQRLALACAVMHDPEVLFLDEPTSGVDPITRREFWTHINGLTEKGVAVLVTTHFMEEAEYCDDIALIYKGRSIAEGAPDELKKRVASDDNADPSMEDAFISLVETADIERAEAV